jgi:hypothetical protein
MHAEFVLRAEDAYGLALCLLQQRYGATVIMRRYTPLLGFLCLLLLAATPVGAVTNQGLDWGFDVGDRFDFHFRYVDHQNSMYSKEYDFYFEVVSLSTIPDGITGLTIPYLNLSCAVGYYFANGTDLGPYAAVLPGLALPVGNWSLWTSIIEAIAHPTADYYTFDASDSGTAWSYYADYGGVGIPHEQGSVIYLKADGVLTRFEWKAWDAMGSPLYEYYVRRLGYDDSFPVVLVTLVGVFVAVVVIIVVFSVLKRR